MAGFLQHDSTVPESQKSSEILEELLNQGIIPEGQTKEKSKMTGEAYSIMVGAVITSIHTKITIHF